MQGLGVLFGSIVLFTVEWRIALITLLGLLLCVTLPIRLERKTARMGYDFKNKEARHAQTVQENVSAHLRPEPRNWPNRHH